MKNPRLSIEQINNLLALQRLHSHAFRTACSRTYLAPGPDLRMTLFVDLDFFAHCHEAGSRPAMRKAYYWAHREWDHREGFVEIHVDDPAIVDAISIAPARIGGAS